MALIDWDNKQWKTKESGDFCFDLEEITEKTFDITAQKWSRIIANVDRGVEKNQLRNFYDKVLELEEKAMNADENEFKTKVLPFVKMLNSKVVYASNKQQGSVNKAFVIFMEESLKQINSKETFQNFKYLFEAVIGFYEKEDARKSIFFIKQNKEKNDNRGQNRNNNYRGRR
ncbi:MAG TPA: type III-A CRISPR-associated protein Csm2 [Arcobacter sp.]|nr:type III-A CRISPR-associated protein Csm2 [Arcobacter sp.]